MHSCIHAGGVAVGVALSAVHQPWEAMTIGFSAAVLSAVGFQYLKVLIFLGQNRTEQGAFASRISPHFVFQVHMLLAHQCQDTCNVLSTHGIPGLLGWVAHLLLQIRDVEDHTM